MGITAVQETAETTFSTQQHLGQHVRLQQLQQIVPLKDWTVQSQQLLQLYHRLIHGATTIVF